jgi:hypothetical protein
LRPARAYLAKRFPFVPRVVPVLFGYLCCYLLYGHASGVQAYGWPTFAGAASGVLLVLVRRIADDLEDVDSDIESGRLRFADGGRRYRRGLRLGGLAAAAAAVGLGAICGPALLLATALLAAWIPLSAAIRNRLRGRSRALFHLLNESGPALGLLYPYLVWHQVTGASLPAIAVISLAGLLWTCYELWNFTRKLGSTERWPPWAISLNRARVLVLAYLALAAGFGLLVAFGFDLGPGYAIYAAVLPAAFAASVLRWWRRLPAGGPDGVRAAWAGAPFGAAVEVGLLIALLGS